MKQLKITLVRSTNSVKKQHSATVAALGLRKIGQSVVKNDDAAIRGMVHSVAHLVTCEEV